MSGSEEGEPVHRGRKKCLKAFNVFLTGTYEEYDLMEEHMAEVCVGVEKFTESTVFDSETT